MIGRQAIRLENDSVVQVFVIPTDLTAHHVHSLRLALIGHLEADDVLFPGRNALAGFCDIQAPAQAVITEGELLLLLLLTDLFEAFRRAEAMIGLSALDQFSGPFMVQLLAL